MSDTIVLNNRGLKQLIKAFKTDIPTGRIGILGGAKPREPEDGKAAPKGGEPTNAFIGACHEFGTSKLPRRSFLRDPLSTNLDSHLKRSGAFKDSVLKEVVATGNLVGWLKAVMVVAEGVVAQAFDTGNQGKWKPSNMKYKTNWQTLVETHQLRDSITTEVKK